MCDHGFLKDIIDYLSWRDGWRLVHVGRHYYSNGRPYVTPPYLNGGGTRPLHVYSTLWDDVPNFAVAYGASCGPLPDDDSPWYDDTCTNALDEIAEYCAKDELRCIFFEASLDSWPLRAEHIHNALDISYDCTNYVDPRVAEGETVNRYWAQPQGWCYMQDWSESIETWPLKTARSTSKSLGRLWDIIMDKTNQNTWKIWSKTLPDLQVTLFRSLAPSERDGVCYVPNDVQHPLYDDDGNRCRGEFENLPLYDVLLRLTIRRHPRCILDIPRHFFMYPFEDSWHPGHMGAFGSWLFEQNKAGRHLNFFHSCFIDESFPWHGSPEDVIKHIQLANGLSNHKDKLIRTLDAYGVDGGLLVRRFGLERPSGS